MFKSGNGGSVDGIPALGANLALISGPTGMITTSVTTATELSYLSGTTSNVQAQLNTKFVLPALTSGSVIFSNGTTLAQDNANFFWDDTNNRLGVGTAAPSQALHVSKSTAAAPVTSLVENTDATSAASDAHVRVRTATGGGNPHFIASRDAAAHWSWGLDASASDVWRLAASLSLGTNTYIEVTAAGLVKILGLTANRAVVTDLVKGLTSTATTSTEIGYVSGVTSAIQTQINSKMTNPMTTGGDVIYGGASGVPTRLANGTADQVLASAGGTAAPTWRSLTNPTVQKFTSGSGTYTTPAGVKYIKVTMVGGGAGGAGGGSPGAGAGGAGGSTTFGTNTAGGGSAGGNGATGGIGGVATLGTIVGISANGGGGGAGIGVAVAFPISGVGASSALGGGGQAATNTAGGAGVSGGGGGGGSGSSTTLSGSGGGAGAYIEGIIASPAATYSYSVGAQGTAGAAGTNGFAGGVGGGGMIVVTEYYQ